MQQGDLKDWQAKRLHEALGPTVGYLSRLQARMEKRGFPPNDPLFQLVGKARDAMQHLCMELHYLSCRNGVGRSSRQER